jgi:hypothetical protein
VSTEDYARDLDEACSALEQRTRAIGEVQATDPAELSRRLEQLRRAIRAGVARVEDIERPEGADGDRAAEYVRRLDSTFEDEVLPALDDLEAAVRARDRVAIRAAATRVRSIDFDRTERLARDLGAEACAGTD